MSMRNVMARQTARLKTKSGRAEFNKAAMVVATDDAPVYLSTYPGQLSRLPFTDSMHTLLVQRDPRKRDCCGTARDRQSTLK